MTWYNTSWLKRKTITLDNALTASTLTDFPVHVPLDDSSVRASARADTRDVLFTSADGTTKLSHELVARRRVSNTSWTWFTDPRALYDGAAGKLYVGGTAANGDIIISQLVLATGLITSFTLSAALDADDHSAPAIYILVSGRIVAFYSKHNDATGHRYRISTSAGDISAWGSEQVVSNASATYQNPFLVNGLVYLFCRNSGTDQVYYTASEANLLTNTWTGPTVFFTTGTGTPYLRFAKNGSDRVDIVANERAPNEAGGNHVGHFYMQDVAGTATWKNSFGTTIVSFPVTIADATQIYDGTSVVAYSDQIAIDGSGNPRVLYTTYPTPGTDHRYNTSRWNPSIPTWTTPVEVVPSGGALGSNNYYSGGICFDGNDTNKIYLSKKVSSIDEMQEWTSADDGATWAKSRDITTSTPTSPTVWSNSRPVSPIGHNGKPALLFLQGYYNLFTDYSTVCLTDPPIAFEAHVKVPSYSTVSDTVLYCYYGNSTAADQSNATGTWNSAYMCVMHMAYAMGYQTFRDSTGVNTGTPVTSGNIQYPRPIVTLAWEGVHFESFITTKIDLGAINFASLAAGTLEALINYEGTAGHKHDLWTNVTGASPTSGAAQMRIDPDASGVISAFMRQSDGTFVGTTFDLSVTANAYHHAAQVWDASEMRVVIDGTTSSTSVASGGGQPSSASPNIYLGYDHYGASDPFLGLMDEIRFSNVRRTEDWLKATSRILKTPAIYIVWGNEETPPASIDALFFGGSV